MTAETNKVRRVVPELHEASQQEIVDHVQSSNRPVEGNLQYISNYVSYEDLETAIHTPAQPLIKTFYSRFYRADGFIIALSQMENSLRSMELEAKFWDSVEVNSFERFLQHAVYVIRNTQH